MQLLLLGGAVVDLCFYYILYGGGNIGKKVVASGRFYCIYSGAVIAPGVGVGTLCIGHVHSYHAGSRGNTAYVVAAIGQYHDHLPEV